MDAMILAAGLGTRLGEVTREVPKALVDVAGKPAIQRVAESLVHAGADRIIINVHHHADRIVEYVRSTGDFGVDVVFSYERDAPLETGGGMLAAAPLFRGDAPFFAHNVDVFTDADLRALHAAHAASGALATLAVQDRATSRRLLFDEAGLLGRAGSDRHLRPPQGEAVTFAFAGIHVASPALFEQITERGVFSIMDVYLRLAAEPGRVRCHDIGSAAWHEIGSLERLERAREHFAQSA